MFLPTGSRCAELDARTSRPEGVIEQIGHRLTNLARGQRELSARIDSGFREINSRLFTALCWIIGNTDHDLVDPRHADHVQARKLTAFSQYVINRPVKDSQRYRSPSLLMA